MKPTTLEELIIRDEGIKLHAYEDHLGYLTLGVGRLIDKRKGGGISREEALLLLHNDLKKCRDGVHKELPWSKNLSPIRQAVLISMAFQMGIAGLLGFRNTLAMIQRGDFKAAASGMLNSRWATQTPARAKRLAKQLETDTWQ